MKMKSQLILLSLVLGLNHGVALANDPSELNDLEIAHVAYTADNIDIKYAHLALALSSDPSIHNFAKTMIRDHSEVNKQALALLKKLNAQPQDNFLSKSLNSGADTKINELSKLRGANFDKKYAENELAYHKSVNNLVENSFIPNIENSEVKTLFKTGLQIFRTHEQHAVKMINKLQ